MKMENLVWTEKYRPRTLEDLIISKEDKIKLEGFIKEPLSMPNLLFVGLPGIGKCFGIDTPIMMYDGSIKKVQNIVNGDKVMGIDSKPKLVSGVTTGKSKMYIVEQIYGDNYIVNEDHILALIETNTNKRKEIMVKEYVKLSDSKKDRLKGYKRRLIFPEVSNRLWMEPYYLGLWLGDGNSHDYRISSIDLEIEEYLYRYSKKLGYRLVNHCGNPKKCKMWSISNKTNKKNVLMDVLRGYKLINNKHIPNDYMYNNRENRLQLLAGLIDSDGCKQHECYDIAQKSTRLSNDIVFLARSLGFRATISKEEKGIKSTGFKGIYNRITISGELWKVPVILERKKVIKHKRQKDTLRYGITIKEYGYGDYYGFCLGKQYPFPVDKGNDSLFLLGDFTVTHNTTIAELIPILIKSPRGDYVKMNSSDDRKIDAIREKVKPFITARRKNKNIPKIIHMDEFDGTKGNKGFQDALRPYMEGKYNNNCKFILTANRIGDISPAIRGERCTIFTLSGTLKEDIKKRLIDICRKESVSYTDEGLQKVIDINYPSLRRMVSTLQRNKDIGITLDTVKSTNELNQSFYTILINKSLDKRAYMARKFIIDNGLDSREVLKHVLFQAMNDQTITSESKYNLSQYARQVDADMASGNADDEVQMWGFITYFIKTI